MLFKHGSPLKYMRLPTVYPGADVFRACHLPCAHTALLALALWLCPACLLQSSWVAAKISQCCAASGPEPVA